MLATRMAPHAEDVRGKEARIQLYEVAPAAPAIARLAEEIVYLEGLVGGDAERRRIDVDPGRVCVRDVEVHHHQHGTVLRPLGVTEYLIIVGRVKLQVGVVLQRAILVTDAI